MAKKNTARKPTSKNARAQTVRADVSRKLVRDETFVSLYTNDTQVQVSPWDFRLIFGQISSVPTEQDKTVLVREVGDVRMSPQHAKRIVQVLNEQLAGYESRFGPIPHPKD